MRGNRRQSPGRAEPFRRAARRSRNAQLFWAVVLRDWPRAGGGPPLLWLHMPGHFDCEEISREVPELALFYLTILPSYATRIADGGRQQQMVRSPKSEVRSPKSGVRSPESEVRSRKSKTESVRTGGGGGTTRILTFQAGMFMKTRGEKGRGQSINPNRWLAAGMLLLSKMKVQPEMLLKTEEG